MPYSIEQILIALVVAGQVILSIWIVGSIMKFRSIFREKLVVISGYIHKNFIRDKEQVLANIVYERSETAAQFTNDDDYLRIAITATAGSHKTITRLNETINNYLVNNYGASVNFSLIKDIIDREIDIKDEEISQSVPTPLYLGLAATMIGIIFGLMSMPDLKGDEFSAGIKVLIDSVKIAMIASLSGLFCTTVLSSFIYKSARRKTLVDKNEQISDLQINLLPELIRAEDTGVTGLKASLDKFARQATRIVNNVNDAATQTSLNISAQTDLIAKVEKIDMLKVSNINLQVFDRIEKSLDALNHFAGFLAQMQQISINLEKFSTRTTNIDLITGQISTTLKDSKELYQFLTMHLQEIKTAGAVALQAVNYSDTHFRQAVDALTIESNARIANLNKSANTHESNLKDIYDEIAKKLQEIASDHIKTFTEAYHQAVPQFGELKNLKLLPQMQESLSDHTTTNANNLLESIHQLTGAVNSLKHHLNSTTGFMAQGNHHNGNYIEEREEEEEEEEIEDQSTGGFFKRTIRFLLRK